MASPSVTNAAVEPRTPSDAINSGNLLTFDRTAFTPGQLGRDGGDRHSEDARTHAAGHR